MIKITKADAVAAKVRSEILAGRLRPGEQLKFQIFAAKFNASVGVMREAFGKLVELGLVEVEAHQGFRVKSLSFEELVDLTDARVEIEGLVFKQAIETGSLNWEAEIIAAHHVLVQTPLHDPSDPTVVSDQWAIAHEHFHATLLSACTNQRLLSFAMKLREEAELYRRWSVSLPKSTNRDVAAEHQELMELATLRRAEEGSQTLKTHIGRTTELVLQQTGEPFNEQYLLEK